MAKKLNKREIVCFEEVLIINFMEQEALINLLVKKGTISKEELLEDIKRLKEIQKRMNFK